MARINPIEYDSLTAEQRQVYDAIESGPRGGVRGPVAVWLRSFGLADKAQKLGAFCRYETTLPTRLTELAILIVAAHWKAGFAWHGHENLALSAGLSQSAIDAIRIQEPPIFENRDEKAVYEFADQLLREKAVRDAEWLRARDAIGEQGAVELVGVLGYYTLICMSISAFEIDMQEGVANPFAAAIKGG